MAASATPFTGFPTPFRLYCCYRLSSYYCRLAVAAGSPHHHKSLKLRSIQPLGMPSLVRAYYFPYPYSTGRQYHGTCVCGSECRLDLCGTGERRTNSSLDWLPMSALPEELPGARPEGHAHVQPDVFGMFSASPCGSFPETKRERAVDSMICFFSPSPRKQRPDISFNIKQIKSLCRLLLVPS